MRIRNGPTTEFRNHLTDANTTMGDYVDKLGRANVGANHQLR
ncbi:MAG: hypothetical protein Q8R36_03075 [bacterium]|nr:hypothetical protein [bacterium]